MAKEVVPTSGDPPDPTKEGEGEGQEEGEGQKKGKKKEPQGVTAEQFEELKKAQSGSDKMVKELQSQLKAKDDAAAKKEQEDLDSKKTQTEKDSAVLAGIRKELDDSKAETVRANRRSAAVEESTRLELPAELDGVKLLDLLPAYGTDEEMTKGVGDMAKYLKAYFAQQQPDHLKNVSGRTVTKTLGSDAKYLTMAQISSMSPAEQYEKRDLVSESMQFLESQQ